MAELIINIHNTATYEPGDILLAYNNNRIHFIALSHICHMRNTPLNSDGLRSVDAIAFHVNKKMYQYRFERISSYAVMRINQVTLDETIHDRTTLESIDVPSFLRRRKNHANHAIFGEKGKEVWFGGKILHENVDDSWLVVEQRTTYRKSDYNRAILTPYEIAKRPPITVDDFDNVVKAELESPLISKIDDSILKKRKNKIDITSLGLTAKELADFQNKEVELDLRGKYSFSRSNIVEAKTA